MKTWKKVFWSVLGIAIYYNVGAIWLHETKAIVCSIEPLTLWQHFRAGGWDMFHESASHCSEFAKIPPMNWWRIFILKTLWFPAFVVWFLSWVAFGAVWLSSWILYGIFGGIGLWIVGA